MGERGALTQGDIASGLRDLGVGPGDVLLVHSSLSAFGHVAGGADAVIDALLDAVAPGGTVLVPTHTWNRENAASPVFDFRSTPCCVGHVPETFRRRADALRGLHPTHSCAGIGPLASDLLRGHESQVTPCGSKSPYQRLMGCGGKIVFLGVGLHANTSFHAVEELVNVPWLFDRFEMLYTIDYDGQKRPVPSCRHCDRMPRDFAKMGPVLEGEGAMTGGTIGAADVRIMDAALMGAVVTPMLAEDPFLLLQPEVAERERRRYEGWRRGL